jgi:hypothetical protein
MSRPLTTCSLFLNLRKPRRCMRCDPRSTNSTPVHASASTDVSLPTDLTQNLFNDWYRKMDQQIIFEHALRRFSTCTSTHADSEFVYSVVNLTGVHTSVAENQASPLWRFQVTAGQGHCGNADLGSFF